MPGYGERDFVRALVPVLIGRLPDPFSPSAEDMTLVAEASEKWVENLVSLRGASYWEHFLLDWNNDVSWNELDYHLDLEDED